MCVGAVSDWGCRNCRKISRKESSFGAFGVACREPLQLAGTDKVLTREDLRDLHRREQKLHKGEGGWFPI